MNIVLSHLTYQLRPMPPFRLDLTAWALRREPANILDRWDGRTYRRVLVWTDKLLEVAVAQSGTSEDPRLEVSVAGESGLDLKGASTLALERLLGIKTDLAPFYRLATANTQLRLLVEQFRGVKPPRFLSQFEALVNGFIFQQISLAAGIHLLNRLVDSYGPSLPGLSGHAFPPPAKFAGLPLETLRPLGLSRQKSRAIIELATAITQGLDPEQLPDDDEKALSALYQLRGVGRWTAEYVLLRGLGRLHVFPGDDVGARHKLQTWLGLTGPLDYEGVHKIMQSWQPYAGMVYFHLLLKHLEERGLLE